MSNNEHLITVTTKLSPKVAAKADAQLAKLGITTEKYLRIRLIAVANGEMDALDHFDITKCH